MNISLRTPFTKKTPPPSPAPERAPHVALVPPPPAPPSRSRALTAAEVEAFGAELDQLRAEVMATVGEREATYIRRVHACVRYTEIGGRTLLFAGWLPPAFVLGTGLLSVSKIVDNMELGHNVMHGQYNFLNDPEYRGDTFEWDTACPGDAWRHSHNYLHHNFTNILGKDRDLGYGVLRLTEHEAWEPRHRFQLLYAGALATFFQWGVAMHDLELDRVRKGERSRAEMRAELGPVLRKMARVGAKDYLLFPLLAGPSFLPVLLGNMSANLARNLWAFTIIFCGHFTEDAETFPPESLETETRGAWYLRQLKGSSNLEGGPVFHFFTGNLSHQIEHHLFPDVPALRYAEMAVKVREICERYGQHYNTGSLSSQFRSVVSRIVRLSSPTPAEVAARRDARSPRLRVLS
ncbi:MAG: acyl-CoA desaturase [Sandaracinaceae bacterium]|nr:acyl-CoA desaturase [Myxococcales bacterium]MCB9657676.1 acyl-CoA desaturase [Sandaracinaceae bacterium]